MPIKPPTDKTGLISGATASNRQGPALTTGSTGAVAKPTPAVPVTAAQPTPSAAPAAIIEPGVPQPAARRAPTAPLAGGRGTASPLKAPPIEALTGIQTALTAKDGRLTAVPAVAPGGSPGLMGPVAGR